MGINYLKSSEGLISVGISDGKVLDKKISILTGLGLTVPQAKIYLALAKSKFLDAQTISTNSGIARPDVYRVLGQLEREGFVATIIEEPKRFQAIPIDECLSMLIAKREGKIAELKKEAQALMVAYKPDIQDEKDCCKPEFLLIPNKDALFNKTKKLVTETRECICLLGRRKMLYWCLTYSQPLKAAITRKVNIRLIIDVSHENPENLKPLKTFNKYPTFSLKLLREPMKASFGIYDKKQIIIGTTEEDLPNKYPCLWSNNKQIVDLTQDYFEIMWEKAEPHQL